MTRLIISLVTGATGIASMLAGLGVDAWLHAEDPTLAQREGIFTLSNPGHALLGVGVLLATFGLLSALHVAWEIAGPRGLLGRRAVRTGTMAACAVASAGAVVFALAVSANGHEHAHADSAAVHTHADGALNEHDVPATQAQPAEHDGSMMSPSSGAPEFDHADPHTDGISVGPEAGHRAGATNDHAISEESHMAGPGADGRGHHERVVLTADEIACGNDLVRRTQEGTARFADYDVALAEGYRSNPIKPNATHYGNRAYRLDGNVMDRSRPESLIYYTNPRTGEKALIGALFVMPKGQSGPQPCGAATRWHTHAACVNLATRESIPVDHGATCAEGSRYGESAEMMHVWFIPGRKNGVAPAS